MKHISLFSLAAAALMAASCGSNKQAQAQTDYQYRQWLESRQQAQAQQPAQQAQQPAQEAPVYKQRPTRTLRVEEPCITLSIEDSSKLRAYGTATSYVEKAALAEAERDARNRMAQMLRVSVEGAAQDYTANTSENLKNTATTLGEQVMSQYVAEDLKNTPIIKMTTYDLSDGSVQVYVCIEMRRTLADMEQTIENGLDRSGVVRARQDRDRFLGKMKDGLDAYKQRVAEEAAAEGL